MKCIIAGCENDINPRSKLSICELCRSGMGRWRKRRPAEVMERRRKLTVYGNRIEAMLIEKRRKKK